eukprot:SAG31_NODE_1_length_62978_cov_30.836130_25_plen_1049_part_00
MVETTSSSTYIQNTKAVEVVINSGPTGGTVAICASGKRATGMDGAIGAVSADSHLQDCSPYGSEADTGVHDFKAYFMMPGHDPWKDEDEPMSHVVSVVGSTVAGGTYVASPLALTGFTEDKIVNFQLPMCIDCEVSAAASTLEYTLEAKVSDHYGATTIANIAPTCAGKPSGDCVSAFGCDGSGEPCALNDQRTACAASDGDCRFFESGVAPSAFAYAAIVAPTAEDMTDLVTTAVHSGNPSGILTASKGYAAVGRDRDAGRRQLGEEAVETREARDFRNEVMDGAENTYDPTTTNSIEAVTFVNIADSVLSGSGVDNTEVARSKNFVDTILTATETTGYGSNTAEVAMVTSLLSYATHISSAEGGQNTNCNTAASNLDFASRTTVRAAKLILQDIDRQTPGPKQIQTATPSYPASGDGNTIQVRPARVASTGILSSDSGRIGMRNLVIAPSSRGTSGLVDFVRTVLPQQSTAATIRGLCSGGRRALQSQEDVPVSGIYNNQASDTDTGQPVDIDEVDVYDIFLLSGTGMACRLSATGGMADGMDTQETCTTDDVEWVRRLQPLADRRLTFAVCQVRFDDTDAWAETGVTTIALDLETGKVACRVVGRGSVFEVQVVERVLTQCGADEYQAREPTGISDRECRSMSDSNCPNGTPFAAGGGDAAYTTLVREGTPVTTATVLTGNRWDVTAETTERCTSPASTEAECMSSSTGNDWMEKDLAIVEISVSPCSDKTSTDATSCGDNTWYPTNFEATGWSDSYSRQISSDGAAYYEPSEPTDETANRRIQYNSASSVPAWIIRDESEGGRTVATCSSSARCTKSFSATIAVSVTVSQTVELNDVNNEIEVGQTVTGRGIAGKVTVETFTKTAGKYTATFADEGGDFSTENADLVVTIDGGTTQTIVLTTSISSVGDLVAVLEDNLEGAEVENDGNGVTITSLALGDTSSVTIQESSDDRAKALFTDGTSEAGVTPTIFTLSSPQTINANEELTFTKVEDIDEATCVSDPTCSGTSDALGAACALNDDQTACEKASGACKYNSASSLAWYAV